MHRDTNPARVVSATTAPPSVWDVIYTEWLRPRGLWSESLVAMRVLTPSELDHLMCGYRCSPALAHRLASFLPGADAAQLLAIDDAWQRFWVSPAVPPLG